MTPDEAQSVADVLVTADGGGGACAVAEKMGERFPEFDWSALVDDAIKRQRYPWEIAARR